MIVSVFAERWREIEPLLDRIFDVPVAERALWLQQHCPDAALRALVADALEGADCIEPPASGALQWLADLSDESSVMVPILPSIAGYHVLEFVGAGGMASVFKAERQLPGGSQIVALKVLRIDVHDPDERRRFLREQNILARLQHPHIAQLLDAGFTPTGTPFLALEFVAGQTLLAHCDRLRLGVPARLAVFLDVCAAVEHAHRNLVVHRDLKPNNVLISTEGCVKLVDFGIAKLLLGEDEATRTQAQRLTRAYAAPEQLAGSAPTTAIDVYALGLVLGELLSGTRSRRHLENDAELAFDNAPDAAAAAARGIGASALRRQLRGDLGLIVRTATQTDPARRYASVAALREDVRDYLRGAPLQARADTLGYRFRMFTRRHLFGVAVAALFVATLAGAAIFSSHEARLARRAAVRAEAQAQIAQGEMERSDAVRSFLQGLFDSAAPGATGTESAQQLLARGRERADRDFAATPALRVEILALIGDLERRSGDPAGAREPLELSATLARQLFGPGDKRTLHIEYLIAKRTDETGHFREAVERLQHAVDEFHLEAKPESEEEVQALAWLAGLYERIGDTGKAVKIGEQALDIARRALSPERPALSEALTNLGWIFSDAGRAEQALPLLREALARKRRLLGDQHADVADAMALLASPLLMMGQYSETEQLMRGAVAIDATAYARPHPRQAWHLNDLGYALAVQGKLEEGVEAYRQAVALDRRIFPAGGLNGATSLTNVAKVRLEQGLYAVAEATMREAIAMKERLLGADYVDNNGDYDRSGLAQILVASGKLGEAQKLLDDVEAHAPDHHGSGGTERAFTRLVEAQLFVARGDHAHAVERAREAVAIYDTSMPAGYARTTVARLILGENLHALGRDTDAQAVFTEALRAARATQPPVASVVVRAMANMAASDAALGDAGQARELRVQAEALMAEVPSGRNIARDDVRRLLAEGVHGRAAAGMAR